MTPDREAALTGRAIAKPAAGDKRFFDPSPPPPAKRPLFEGIQASFDRACSSNQSLNAALPADVQAKMPTAPQLRPLDVVKASQLKPKVDRLWDASVLSR